MRYTLILFALVFPCIIHANTLRLKNNTPYPLQAFIHAHDGTLIVDLFVKAGTTATWTESTKGLPQTRTSPIAPFSVVWICQNGELYSRCDGIARGTLVIAQQCTGPKVCRKLSQ